MKRYNQIQWTSILRGVTAIAILSMTFSCTDKTENNTDRTTTEEPKAETVPKQTLSGIDVSEEQAAILQEAMSKSFPDMKDAQWSKEEDDSYEVVFMNGDDRMEVKLDASGNVLEKEISVTPGMLPPKIMEYITIKHVGYEIHKVEKVSKPGEEMVYEVELRNETLETELVFDAEGNYLRTEKEDSGDD